MPGSVAFKLIAVAAVLVAVHVATVSGAIRLAVVVLFCSLAMAPALSAGRAKGRRRYRHAALATVLFGVAALAAAWPGLEGGLEGETVLILPPLIGYMTTSAFFAQSLLPGQVPVIVRMCRVSRGDPLPDGLESYARMVTWGWAVLPALLALGALIVFWFLGLEAWSWIGNIANPLVLIGFFLGEHLYRFWRMPNLDKPSLATTFDVMLNSTAWRGPS